MGGFGSRQEPVVSVGIVIVGAMADEIRADEVEGEGDPEEPLAMSEAEAVLVLVMPLVVI